jgi:hypothetical protein
MIKSDEPPPTPGTHNLTHSAPSENYSPQNQIYVATDNAKKPKAPQLRPKDQVLKSPRVLLRNLTTKAKVNTTRGVMISKLERTTLSAISERKPQNPEEISPLPAQTPENSDYNTQPTAYHAESDSPFSSTTRIPISKLASTYLAQNNFKRAA